MGACGSSSSGSSPALFSALFGVGGGIVIVPLLLLVAAFGPREATATSLGAIVITALGRRRSSTPPHGKVHVGLCRARRSPGDGRRAASARQPSSASPAAGPDVAFARPPRGCRRLADRRMSTTTIVLAVVPRSRCRRDVRPLRRRWGDPLRPDARRARPRSGRGGRDVAARGRSRRRRSGAAGRHATATCGCEPPLVARCRLGRRRRVGVQIATSMPEDVLRRLFGVLLVVVAGQLAWRAVRAHRRLP